jgi:hypothetical protein
MTMVDGEIVVDEFAPVDVDPREVSETAQTQARALAARAGL